MTGEAPTLNVRDVLSLTTKLAERMLHLRSTGHTHSVGELEAIVKAAEFLHERKVPWPTVVTEVIDILAAQMEIIRAAPPEAEVDGRLLLTR